MEFQRQRGRFTLTAQAIPMGQDLCVAVWGGDRPHVGCAALAAPHPSLRGDGSPSATVSTLNLPAHRDDGIANAMARRLSTELGRPVAVVCGVHADGASGEDIRTLLDLARLLGEDILRAVRGDGRTEQTEMPEPKPE